MKCIVTLILILFSFLGQAQDAQNEISILQDKINQFEKLGDTLNEQYGVIFKDLGYLFQKQKNMKTLKLYF